MFISFVKNNCSRIPLTPVFFTSIQLLGRRFVMSSSCHVPPPLERKQPAITACGGEHHTMQEESNGVCACTFVMIRKRQVKIAVLFTPRSTGLDRGRQIEDDRFGTTVALQPFWLWIRDSSFQPLHLTIIELVNYNRSLSDRMLQYW